jgi:NHL repeat
MIRRRPLVLAALLACACAPAPVVVPEAPRPSWPAAPARPLVRYVGAFPDATTRREAPPWWKRAFHLAFGIDDGPRADAALLARPFGLAAAGDRLYVADPDARRVLRVEWRRNAWEAVECASRPWVMPMAVAAADDATLWVADAGAGALVHVAGDRCDVVGQGALERPTGVALAGGRVYAVDPPRHEIVTFSPDGREVARFGARGGAAGQFNYPTSLAVDADGRLLVVDALNFRVVRLDPDGRFVGAFGEAGDGGGAFGRPKAVAVDPGGHIYVTDAQNDVVIAFNGGGRFLAAAGGAEPSPGSLDVPAGVAVSGAYLFVADSQEHRVQIYALLEAEP